MYSKHTQRSGRIELSIRSRGYCSGNLAKTRLGTIPKLHKRPPLARLDVRATIDDTVNIWRLMRPVARPDLPQRVADVQAAKPGHEARAASIPH